MWENENLKWMWKTISDQFNFLTNYFTAVNIGGTHRALNLGFSIVEGMWLIRD